VTAFLRTPACIESFSLPEWDLLLRQARRADLTARIYWLLREENRLHAVPTRALPYLENAWVLSERQRSAVAWELKNIGKILRDLDIQVILLKGAAYFSAGLPAANGRVLSDIDILVPQAAIADVEAAFIRHGWVSTHLDAYDQRYYRRWMHEIPPIEHPKRGTVLDIHHAILPITARIQPDMDKLRQAAIPLDREGNFATLAPPDMILHSAAHLFYDSELGHGLRDLVDLDALLRDYGMQSVFWEQLLRRANEVGLSRALYYALRYTQRILGTPIPTTAIQQSETDAPLIGLRWLMDCLYTRAFIPQHPSCKNIWADLADLALFIRGHWLRMPPWLLLRHLFHKAFISPKDSAA